MRSVKVNRDELLAIIIQNAAKHAEEYETAMTVYKTDVVEKLTKMLKAAKAEAQKDKPSFDLYVNLVEPQSYQDSYTTAIKMLNMSTDDVIELTASEFSQYVEDNWNWKAQFTASTAMYNAKAALK